MNPLLSETLGKDRSDNLRECSFVHVVLAVARNKRLFRQVLWLAWVRNLCEPCSWCGAKYFLLFGLVIKGRAV